MDNETTEAPELREYTFFAGNAPLTILAHDVQVTDKLIILYAVIDGDMTPIHGINIDVIDRFTVGKPDEGAEVKDPGPTYSDSDWGWKPGQDVSEGNVYVSTKPERVADPFRGQLKGGQR